MERVPLTAMEAADGSGVSEKRKVRGEAERRSGGGE